MGVGSGVGVAVGSGVGVGVGTGVSGGVEVGIGVGKDVGSGVGGGAGVFVGLIVGLCSGLGEAMGSRVDVGGRLAVAVGPGTVVWAGWRSHPTDTDNAKTKPGRASIVITRAFIKVISVYLHVVRMVFGKNPP